MNIFKVGDKVMCVNIGISAVLVVGDVYTVAKCSGNYMKVVECLDSKPRHSYAMSLFVAHISEREEVENALAVMAKHDIRRFVSSAHNHDRGYRIKDRHFLCEIALLDNMFPKKNKELEALKKKQGELAEAIEALEKSL